MITMEAAGILLTGLAGVFGGGAVAYLYARWWIANVLIPTWERGK